MPPEIQARVFDPFFSTRSSGSGLGPAVVYGIVRGLGSVIQVMSERDQGTTFQVLLPAAEAVTGITSGTVIRSSEPARLEQAATVLFVEDEEQLRQATSKMLRKPGFLVIEAENGNATLDAIRSQQSAIQVLFLDITIPGATSREVLEEAGRLKPEIKVIVASAYTEEMAAASLQTKIECFLRKPYGLADLTRFIRLALS